MLAGLSVLSSSQRGSLHSSEPWTVQEHITVLKVTLNRKSTRPVHSLLRFVGFVCFAPFEHGCRTILAPLGAEVPKTDGDRKSVVSGKSVSVRVDLGCGRILKNKNKDIMES